MASSAESTAARSAGQAAAAVPLKFVGKSYYEVLGLDQKRADKDAINKGNRIAQIYDTLPSLTTAYRRAALRLHPDHNKSEVRSDLGLCLPVFP